MNALILTRATGEGDHDVVEGALPPPAVRSQRPLRRLRRHLPRTLPLRVRMRSHTPLPPAARIV